MGKYSSYVRDLTREEKRRKEVHPVWRGIGFILMVVLPILSYFFMDWLLKANITNGWFPMPTDILSPWGPDPLIFVKILIMVIFIIAALAVLMLIYFLINLIFGPPRYGPHDAPPVKPATNPRRSR